MTSRRRVALLVAVAIVAVASGLGARAGGWLEPLERSFLDSRFELVRPKLDEARDVVVVAIDGHTTAALGEPRVPRRYHARMIDLLARAGARVIAYDLEFLGETSVRDDNALVGALQRHPGVVLAAVRVAPDGDYEALGGPANVRAVRARIGDAQVLLDPDGSWRRIEYRPRRLPTFSEAVARAYSRHPLDSAASGRPGSSVPIAYQGPPGTFRRLSFVDLLRGEAPASAVHGKIAIVGNTDPALGDVHQTPLAGDGLMPGPEIQANAVATVLAGAPLDSAPGWLDVVAILALGTVAPLGGLRLRANRAILACGIAVAVYLVVVALAFRGGSILSVSYPLLAALVGAGGTYAAQLALERRERVRQRRLFSRFVPEQVVERAIRARDSDLRAATVPLDATVMFSDVRGFTRFAERLDPDRVVEALNRYLGEMSDAITAHGGTVIDYMGDGVMAVFGAPEPLEDHADRALAAAQEMVAERLPRFNEWLAREGLGDGFRIGIGINSGPIISANVGSKERVAYTAIGDTTNTASRIEAMTKEIAHDVLLAESTVERLARRPEHLAFVDEIEVRGRDERARLWALTGEGC